ncbi:MAG: hypothetical protein HZC28_19835 [Spirochaetes bacterium]|nr:hypothetical protein [Spirochaetota bacterium]
MKKIFVVCIAAAALLSAQVKPAGKAEVQSRIPQIGIMDIMSSSFERSKTRMLTDVLRTELFKVHLFKIIERGVLEKILQEHSIKMTGLISDVDLLKIGKILAVEKLFVCTLEKFSSTIAVNIRIIDVNTSLVDYTENVFVKDEDMIFDALKDIVKKIELYYAVKGDEVQTENKSSLINRKWVILGATEEEIKYFILQKTDPESFLDLRQYDITFKPADYVDALKRGWDSAVIKNFLQAGIPYKQVQKALSLGIVSLDNFKKSFRYQGYSFEDYLDAYANNIMTVNDYKSFKEGYRKDRFIVGLGGVADNLPIAIANYKFLLGMVGWEHFWSEYQRGIVKFSTDVSLNMMNIIVPIPSVCFNVYAGMYPFYAKLSLGGHAEIILGGHYAALGKIGVEVAEQFAFDAFFIFYGTQPGISYTDLKTKKGEAGYIPINYPYYAAMFSYKF